ncbi:MAG: hypothetical protein WC459_01585 [Patescibacteria group bacterium]
MKEQSSLVQVDSVAQVKISVGNFATVESVLNEFFMNNGISEKDIINRHFDLKLNAEGILIVFAVVEYRKKFPSK